MTSPVRILLALIAGVVASGSLRAADNSAPAHPVVPSFERFFVEAKGDQAQGGRLLLGELNCTSCHQTADATAARLQRKQAPILDGVGSRVRRSFLRKFLADPHGFKPGTTMPDVLATVPEKDRAETLEALVHFLSSTGTQPARRPDPKQIKTGAALYGQVGCAVCHGPRAAGASLPHAVPLGDLAAKYSIPTLAAFLAEPHKTRPAGRMPGLLDNKEALAVANYLLPDASFTPLAPNLTYRYYEGAWQKLPDFGKLEPKAKGPVAGFNMNVARRGNNMGLRFEGYLRLQRPGDYTFYLNSDDGSKLFINGKLVVDNDGIHAPATKSARAKLEAGVHPIAVDVFNLGGGAELSLDIAGNGLGRQSIQPLLFMTRDAKPIKLKPKPGQEDEAFPLDPGKIARGRELFGTLGCASCHVLNLDKKKPIASTLAAPKLADLKAGSGCLAAQPGSKSPRFHLSAAQRSALQAGLKSLADKKADAIEPKELIAGSFLAFNCYACHDRDKIGGVEENRNKLFQTTQPEMGDEGRLPPTLTGVGAKLTADWLKTVFAQGSKDRPYMHTRMPRFGVENVGKLIPAFEAVDKIKPAPAPRFDESLARIKAEGRHLVGAKAFGCIKCHTFAGHKAEGIQAMDLAVMTQRLKRDWFHRYLTNPFAYRPGTRMPSPFPDGQSTLPAVLGGDAAKQSEALWLYLKDGTKAGIPAGIVKNMIALVPEKEAILYRNFVQGAGARAIAVGYPEKAHLAFDANDMRLALLWQGAFMDASRHWNGRGVGYQPPLGDAIVSLTGGASFAHLASPTDAWPGKSPREMGYRFRGYRLTKDQRPTFRYDFGSVHIEDFPNAVKGEARAGIVRELTLSADKPGDDLYFRAAVAKEITPLKEGWFAVGKEYRIRFKGADAQIRAAGDKKELIVPVRFKNGKAAFTEEFAW